MTRRPVIKGNWMRLINPAIRCEDTRMIRKPASTNAISSIENWSFIIKMNL